MCGIVGYVGAQQPASILLDGLKRLEYRGYDSAGIAIFDHGTIKICRCEGKIAQLEKLMATETFDGTIGIGHTRWATHGRPSEANAHPHYCDGVAVVHNGIIENYLELKAMLTAEGSCFSSETDSEVLCHLIAKFLRQGCSFVDAVRRGLALVRGSYAIAVLSEHDPQTLIAARKESPLIIGLGSGENFVASDIPAILSHTRSMIFLDDGDLAIVTADSVTITRLDGTPVVRPPRTITWDPVMAEKGGYKHFMLKEIFEQPRAIIDTLRGRLIEDTAEVFLDRVQLDAATLRSIMRIAVVACGTSYYAGLVGKFLLERLTHIPVEVDLASEFRYRDPLIGSDTLVVLISQSGETADTLAAMREAQRKDAQTLCICNVVESTLARDCDHVLYTHAGPEIGVASTKAFTSQIAALVLLGLHIGRARGVLDERECRRLMQHLIAVPGLVEKTLELEPTIKRTAEEYMNARNFLYLARGINYPIALEGALKLKEISYIHAEGYPAGEMKHGPIALIDENMPVVVLAQRDTMYEKVLGNVEEVKARKGRVIAVAPAETRELAAKADHTIVVPETDPMFMPFVLVVPLQLFAYHVADAKGTDVDQPRNLAKSVTVE
ncbi:MAG: glutamine--fructose-6-phosphate transaminase (isomerizing) [Desulfobacterota bacterium]|nr:glutamine--fructose-6-phosphate transaminase (isomerizing) [Thermodesulfobacteriota bacterium]